MPAPFATFLCTLCVIAGCLGAWLPGLPGLPLMAGGALLAKVFAPDLISWWTVSLFLLTALVGVVLDLLLSIFSSRLAGATKPGIYGAMVGALVGVFFSLPGLLLGPLVGALLGELLISKRAFRQAFRAGLGATLGFLAGTVGKGLLALGLLFVFAVDALVF